MVVMGLLGLVFIVFGYFIAVKKMLVLIAGYREETFTGNKDKLAKTVGMAYVIIGILTLLLPFGLDYIGSMAGIIYAAVVVIGAASFMAKMKRRD
nr:DUF3784 domain-containing protein [Paenibacillus guangzhouensis]